MSHVTCRQQLSHVPPARPWPAQLARATARRAAAAAVGGGADRCLLPLETHDPFPSTLAPPRRVDIMLPPSYHSHPTQRFPVLYMLDGQNAVDPGTSFAGVDWGLDEALLALTTGQQQQQQQQHQHQQEHQQQQQRQQGSAGGSGAIREFVAVLVWNTPVRLQEYMPAAPLRWLMQREQCWYERVDERYYNPTSDAFLDMLVQELKPFVDATFRTLTGQADTALLGSSMGGLVAVYALARHPQVFGAAACVSTHWPPGGGVVGGWLADGHLPDPGSHRLYFDHGSEGLDALYPPFQRTIDALCRGAGYREGVNFASRVFPGEGHDEAAWRRRLAEPLRFLFGVQ